MHKISMKPRAKAKVGDLPNQRAQVLEALLDASLHLHQFKDAPKALQESFLAVSEIINAHTMLLYRHRLAGYPEEGSKCLFGIMLQGGEWHRVEEQRMPIVPGELLRQCVQGCFSPIDTSQIGWSIEHQFWSTAINQNACLLIGLNSSGEQSAELASLQPFVQALEGFLARTDAEEKVQTQRNYLRTIIDNMPGLVFAKDKQGRFVIANKKVAELYGVPVRDLIGKTDRHFHHNQLEVERYLKEDRRVIEEGKTLRLPNDHISTKRGQKLFLNTTKVPVPSADGESVHVLGIAQDITHQRQVEQRERASRYQYENFIQHTTEGIYNIKCTPPIPIHLSIEDQVDWFYAYAYLADCNRAMAAMYGFDKPEEMIGKKIAELHDGPGKELNRKAVTKFFREGFQVQGLETFERRKDGRQTWFVNHSAGVLEDGVLTDIWGGQIDVTERKQMELSLREKQQELELVLEGAKVATWHWKVREQEARFNEYFAQMLGYELEELPKTPQAFNELVHPDDLEPFIEKAKHYLQPTCREKTFEHEMRLRTKDGAYRWVLNRGRATVWDEKGYPNRGSGILVDITERKEVELALRQKQEFLDLASKATEVFFWQWQFGEEATWFSRDFLTALGYNPESPYLDYNGFFGMMHEEDRVWFAEMIDREVWQNQRSFKAEIRLKKRDGSYLWFYDHCESHIINGKRCLVGLLINIDSRKRTEIALKESQQRLELAIESSSLGIWEWDMAAEKVHNSRLMLEQLGHENLPEFSSYSEWIGLLHPEDIPLRMEQFEQQTTVSDTFELEYRIRNHRGEYHWLYDRGIVTARSEEGKATYALGISIDISERKYMELRLRESKERTELVLDAAKLGLWEWDPQNDTCHYNQYWGEMLGFSPEEVKPHWQTFEELIHPDDQAIVWQTLQEHLAGKTPYFEAEIRLRTKSGGWKWIYDQGRMVGLDEHGKPKKVVGIHMDIHERKQAEWALRESEALFRGLFEESPLAIVFCSADGIVRQANHKAGQLLGLDQQELIGEQLDSFSAGSSLLEELNEQGRPEHGNTIKMERQLTRKDDGVIWANLLYSMIYDDNGQLDCIICSIEDISSRREAQEALAESKQLKQAILEALPDLKFRLDKNGRFLDYYGAGYDNKNLLMPPEEFLGKKAEEVLPGYLTQALVSNINAAITEGAVQTFDYPMMFKGELRHYEARISAVDAESAIVVVRDVTDLKRTQQNLRKKLEELDRNNEKLTRYVDSNAQLENFAHTVSHDLREPVRTMNSFSQLLQQKYAGKLDENANSYLDFIAQSAQHMNKLIEDLLEFARLTSSSNPEFEQVDLQELAEVVQNSIKGLITDKNAEIVFSQPLPTIMGNRTKLGQLFQNLISNGIKFSQPDRKPRVAISTREKGDYWHFSIADNGIGIDEKHHQQIFQLFRRLHSKKVFPGSGIGLSLCKRVVEQHGGTIYVESKLGEGATFHFTLHKNY
jgi:PAS domain S-box-containing protein